MAYICKKYENYIFRIIGEIGVFAGEKGPGIGVYAGFAFMSAFLCLEIYLSYEDVLQNGCLFYCLMSINALVHCAIFCKTFQLESFLPYYITAILSAGLFEVKQSKSFMLGNALACLICFGISFLYNKIENKVKKKNE